MVNTGKKLSDIAFKNPNTAGAIARQLVTKIDQILIETLELISAASFAPKEEKLPYVKRAIIKLDTVKFLIRAAWEIGSLNEKRFGALSKPLAEIGRMLGGWHNNIKKQTAVPKSGGNC